MVLVVTGAPQKPCLPSGAAAVFVFEPLVAAPTGGTRTVFSAFRERRFTRRIVKQLLASHATVAAGQPGLSGEALYREVLLHSALVDESDVDDILWQAEDSIDEWTSPESGAMGLRQIAHFLVLARYRVAGYDGMMISVKDLVYGLVPAEL